MRVVLKNLGKMLTKTSSWKKLQHKASDESVKDLRKLFSDPERVNRFSFKFGKLHLDLSKNWVDESVYELLGSLAEEINLRQKINNLFDQEIVNVTENQAASHTQIRSPQNLHDNHQALFEFADRIKQRKVLTAFGKPIKHIVNVGIGGSYLGPRLATEAVTDLQSNADMTIDFMASVDDSLINQLFLSIDVTNTLFCISSKSFGTVETLNNAQAILKRLQSLPNYAVDKKRSSMMAITANQERAEAIGIPSSHILNFEKTIGGRFSLWSSIGFPIVMSAGQDAFKELLLGAASMDAHYQQADFSENLPVLMALNSIWYRNFLGLSAYTALPYDARLRCFPAWLQQLMMESTGKMHDASGEQLQYPTSPWVFGDHGQLSQHAFFQAFHQGNDVLPIDFIGVLNPLSDSQQFLLVNMIAQGAALMNGKVADNPLSHCVGNRPSSTLLLEDLSAYALGQLLALYEHMVYTQSVIWGVNCFDQPGVELGKDIARDIEQHIRHNTLNQLQLDPSTEALIQHVFKDES